MIRAADTVLILTILSLGQLLISCDGKARVGEKAKQDCRYIFVDRSDPEMEYAFVIDDTGVFAQACRFPGYTERRFYWYQALSEEMRNEADKWERRPGEIEPPFLPDGPLFSRTVVTVGTNDPPSTEYFKADNAELRKWFMQLREQVVGEEYRVQSAPEGISTDPRIKRRLGM